ncbi:MAG: type I DNA topoisomerase, partial [Patescibacteria group bacterium]
MYLVIVESPTKAKTISGFLGKKYKVESSYGHVRDLPKSKLGIDLEKDFEPQYIIPRKSQKRVTLLKKEAGKADKVILATDEDREGEAIAWHLVQALGLGNKEQIANGEVNGKKTVERIVFHEITKSAIAEALDKPRDLDLHMVDSQQARRVLDRIVGYKLSPFLWKKIHRGLSAGRVQSVALRLIADREEEISKFIPQEHWTIIANLQKDSKKFGAELLKINDALLDKFAVADKERAQDIVDDLSGAKFQVSEVEEKETKRNPLPPFTTSTLQQAAAARLGFSAKRTMVLAQMLYERGYITYMRTDSVNLSQTSLTQAAAWVQANLPKAYHLAAPRRFKNKSRLAQEAHEAIRPSNVDVSADAIKGKDMDAGHRKLYEFIWRRFIASQVAEARFDSLRADIAAQGKKQKYVFRANGNVLRFDGFLKIWPI